MSKATPQFTTIADLGREVRRSPARVHAYLDHPGWRWGRGPWTAAQVRGINEWIAATFSASRADPELTAARVELLQEQLALLNLSNGIAAGEWCDASKVTQLAVAAVHEIKRAMMELPWHPRATRGTTEAEIRESLTEYITDATRAYEAANAKIPDGATAEADPVTLKRRRPKRVEGGSHPGAGRARAARPRAPRTRARAKG